MALIKKPYELKVQALIKVLLYGQPGIGKSTLALSAPQPLYIDCDRGVHRVNSLHRVDTIQVEKWEEMEQLLDEDLTSFSTLVVDTAGKMLDFMSEYLMRLNPKNKQADGSLTLKAYGARKTLFRSYLTKVSALGKHIVFVAHDKEDKKGDNLFVRADIGGSSGADLIRELDLVGYMEAIGSLRTISFEPTESHYGKNTCGLQPLINLPDTSKPGIANDLLCKIFDDYQKGVDASHQLGLEYRHLVNTITSKVDAINDAKTATEAYVWAIETEHIWDSKYLSALKIGEKAKQLGLLLNKETKQYAKAA